MFKHDFLFDFYQIMNFSDQPLSIQNKGIQATKITLPDLQL